MNWRKAVPAITQNTPTQASLLDAVPLRERQRIVSGMRWTVWLAVIGGPFGYATSLILGRVSPEALGTYGLLLVYIQLVQTWLYLGGDAVIINFIPRVEHARRLSFLFSYLLVILTALMPWWAVATIWPRSLHYLFGDREGVRLQLLLLYLAPVCILFFFLLATLKARLEMKWSQGLFRVVTIGSLLTYGTLFLTARHLLATHYEIIIWAVYFAFIAISILLAITKLLRIIHWRIKWLTIRFFLPKGFWHYVLPLQLSSALSMAAGRIDYILVLNLGGLTTLGKYLAVAMIADFMRVMNNLLVDTLLPALTNLLASDNVEGATQIFAVTMRIMAIANIAMGCALIFFVFPIVKLLGPQYIGLTTPMILMACFATLAAPGAISGTLLASVGKQYRVTWLSILRLAISTTTFFALWPHFRLLGAVLASGSALLIFSLALPVSAKFGVPITFSLRSQYVRFALVVVSAAVISECFGPFGLGIATLLWLVAVGVFLAVARYNYAECKHLAQYLLPATRSGVATSRSMGTA